MKTNLHALPPRMRHRFKLRNANMEESTIQLDDEIQLMANNLLKVQRELTEEGDLQREEEGEEGQYVEGDEFGYERNDVSSKIMMQKGIRSDLTDYDQPVLMVIQPQQHDHRPHFTSTQPHQPQDSNPFFTTSSLLPSLIHLYQTHLSNPTLSSNYQQKINHLLDTWPEQVTQMKDIVGNAIGLFQMVYYFGDILTGEVLEEIGVKAFGAFVQVVEMGEGMGEAQRDGRTMERDVRKEDKEDKEDNEQGQQQHHNDSAYQQQQKQLQMAKTCLSQLIAICSSLTSHPGSPNPSIITFFIEHLLTHPLDFQLSYKILINSGPLGITTLIHLLHQDFEQVSYKILSHLCRAPFIVQSVIVPSIVGELTTSMVSTRDRNVALKVLGEMGEVACSQEVVEVLVGLLKDHHVDKGVLVKAIRRVGKQEGERVLMDLLRRDNLNEDVAGILISCLSEGRTNRQQLTKEELNITIVDDGHFLLSQHKTFFHTTTNPITNNSKLYHYQSHPSTNEQTLFINPRIFSSLLQKLSFILEQSLSQEEETQQSILRIKQIQCEEMFVLLKVINKDESEDLLPMVNPEVMSLVFSFVDNSNKKLKLKQAAIQALGNMHLPQTSVQAITRKLSTCLSTHPHPDILTSTCLTLSKLPITPSPKLLHHLSSLVRHNFWKVRISACQAIGALMREPIEEVIEQLIRCLKDGSINRELVCQTLMRVHPVCEVMLMEILKSTQDSKIQEIVLCSFNEGSVLRSENLQVILQTIFEFSTHKRKQLRFICLSVVNSLRKLSEDQQLQISYFKTKNIMPFYYNFLDDPCGEIRSLALNLVLEFGSYAELVLIEGMTRGSINCKLQCAKGLGLRGVHNFRALLLGMRDINEKVRRECCLSILHNYQLHDIVHEYKEKSSQCVSLIYNIKDLLEGNNSGALSQEMRLFLRQLIERLAQNTIIFGQSITEDEVNENDVDEEIEKEILQFREESMKMRRDELSENERWTDHEERQYVEEEVHYNDENANPNVMVNREEKESKQKMEKDCQMKGEENKPKKQNNISISDPKQEKQQKRYYFRLNESVY